MKQITSILFILGLLFNFLWAESISNDLTSSTVGFWTLGTPAPTNGSPATAAPANYTDADYVVMPVGTAEFSWKSLDGTDAEGTVTIWIYDPGKSLENAPNHATRGPYWGVKNSDGTSLVGTIYRQSWSAYDQGYSIYSPATKSKAAWFVDGLRGSKGIPYSAGWYKWGIIAQFDRVIFEIYDVDFFDRYLTYSQIHGTASKVFASDWATVEKGFSSTLSGWNGLAFKGDVAGSPEEIYVAVAGGSGVFAGIADGSTSLPKTIASWGAVKALYR